MRGEIVPIDQHRDIASARAGVPGIAHEVRALRDMTAADPSRIVRRLLFLWLRVHVLERKEGRREERVDVRIPIPLPLVGALFPRSIGWRQALAAIVAGRDAADPSAAMRGYLDSVMALELVRVESEKRGKYELVVVGLD